MSFNSSSPPAKPGGQHKLSARQSPLSPRCFRAGVAAARRVRAAGRVGRRGPDGRQPGTTCRADSLRAQQPAGGDRPPRCPPVSPGPSRFPPVPPGPSPCPGPSSAVCPAPLRLQAAGSPRQPRATGPLGSPRPSESRVTAREKPTRGDGRSLSLVKSRESGCGRRAAR